MLPRTLFVPRCCWYMLHTQACTHSQNNGKLVLCVTELWRRIGCRPPGACPVESTMLVRAVSAITYRQNVGWFEFSSKIMIWSRRVETYGANFLATSSKLLLLNRLNNLLESVFILPIWEKGYEIICIIPEVVLKIRLLPKIGHGVT